MEQDSSRHSAAPAASFDLNGSISGDKHGDGETFHINILRIVSFAREGYLRSCDNLYVAEVKNDSTRRSTPLDAEQHYPGHKDDKAGRSYAQTLIIQ